MVDSGLIVSRAHLAILIVTRVLKTLSNKQNGLAPLFHGGPPQRPLKCMTPSLACASAWPCAAASSSSRLVSSISTSYIYLLNTTNTATIWLLACPGLRHFSHFAAWESEYKRRSYSGTRGPWDFSPCASPGRASRTRCSARACVAWR